MRERCEPSVCVLRRAWRQAWCPLSLHQVVQVGADAEPDRSIQIRFLDLARAKPGVPGSPEVKTMRHNKKISCWQQCSWELGWNSGAYTPSQLSPSPFGTAPKSLPLLLHNVIFFPLQVVEVYTRKPSPLMELNAFPPKSSKTSFHSF